MNKISALLLGLVTVAASSAMADTVNRTLRGDISWSSNNNPYQRGNSAFDSLISTKWLTANGQPTGWLQYGFRDGQAYAINSYTIRSANDEASRDPRDWTLEGSDNGTTWAVVDTQIGQTWSNRNQARSFTCDNTTAYKQYRLNVSKNNGNSSFLQLSEFELFENGVSRTAYSNMSYSSAWNDNESGIWALDGTPDTKWLTAGNGQVCWLQYQFLGKKAYVINNYAITSANDEAGRDPKDWNLLGSNDGTNWTTLDTQTDQSWPDRKVKQEYSFNNRNAYSYYKLDITANNGQPTTQFSELDLLEVLPDGVVKYTAPGIEAVEVPVATPLQWNAGTAKNLAGYYVYMGTTPDELTQLNTTMLSKQTTSYAATLETDQTYYWQIEEARFTDPNGLSGIINPVGDPNNVFGSVWHFSTKTSQVIIDGLLPVNSCVALGENATFSISAIDPLNGNIAYQWYFDATPETSGDAVALPVDAKYVGSDTANLTVNNAQMADQGVYYCSAVNASNRFVYSNSAKLIIKQKIAHWDLDAASYVGTNYTDLSGNNRDALVEGTPVFTDGIVDGDQNSANAVSDGALYLTSVAGTASAGAFNPSADTNMFTLAAWVKPQNITGIAFKMIASKRDGWSAPDQSYWQFFVVDNTVKMSSFAASSINTPAIITENEWHHVVFTFADGTATIYVNGVPSVRSGYNFSTGTQATFRIGRNDSAGERFDGALDDMQVFNYAISPEEVVDLYFAETGKAVCVYGNPDGDLNNDCVVDLLDMGIMANEWLKYGYYPSRP